MDDIERVAAGALARYWHAAVDPLHRLTWETFSLFALILLSAALIATLLLRYSWVWSRPAIRGAKIRSNAHLYQEYLRISPEDYLAIRRVKVSVESEQGKALILKDAPRYYVVTIVQKGRPNALVYQEMRLQLPTRKGRVPQGMIQLDDASLTAVRFNNASQDDDETGAEIQGEYNVYVRRVRWYDIRHWLLHPNREVRIVVWVTLITTTVPTLLQMLFG